MNYIFRKPLRGKGKHCPILKNVASSYSTHCDLSVQGCAQKNFDKRAHPNAVLGKEMQC